MDLQWKENKPSLGSQLGLENVTQGVEISAMDKTWLSLMGEISLSHVCLSE